MTDCPVCRWPVRAEFFRKAENSLIICESCRHICWERFPVEQELSDYYQRQYTDIHSQENIQTGNRTYYAGHLQDLLKRTGRRPGQCQILDYGCSIPVLIEEAVRAGFRRAVGVDYADEVRIHAARNGLEVIPPGGLALVPDTSLDIVRFSHILEHTIDPGLVLGGVLRKVRPGGLVYITQPSNPVLRCRPSPHDLKDAVFPEHLHFFSPISLIELVSRQKLEIQQFFTHQNESAVLAAYKDMVDLEYARERLSNYKSKGEKTIPSLANFPCYAGENSVLYAFKHK